MDYLNETVIVSTGKLAYTEFYVEGKHYYLHNAGEHIRLTANGHPNFRLEESGSLMKNVEAGEVFIAEVLLDKNNPFSPAIFLERSDCKVPMKFYTINDVGVYYCPLDPDSIDATIMSLPQGMLMFCTGFINGVQEEYFFCAMEDFGKVYVRVPFPKEYHDILLGRNLLSDEHSIELNKSLRESEKIVQDLKKINTQLTETNSSLINTNENLIETCKTHSETIEILRKGNEGLLKKVKQLQEQKDQLHEKIKVKEQLEDLVKKTMKKQFRQINQIKTNFELDFQHEIYLIKNADNTNLRLTHKGKLVKEYKNPSNLLIFWDDYKRLKQSLLQDVK